MNEIKQTDINKKPERKKSLLKLVFILIGAGALIFAVLYGYNSIFKNNSGKSKKAVCGQKVIDQAKPLIQENKSKELFELTKEIEKKDGYQKDVNCLYIVTNGYINASDTKNARKNYDLLKEKYDPSKGYSELFGDSVIPPNNIEPIIVFMEKQDNRKAKVIF